MSIRSRMFALILAAMLVPTVGVTALAQTASDTEVVQVQVYSGTFSVVLTAGSAGTFTDAVPNGTASGSLSLIVVDERGGSGNWNVQASIGEFIGQKETGPQRFQSYITWTPDVVMPAGSLVLSNNTALTIKRDTETIVSGVGAKGTSTVSGPATIKIPNMDGNNEPIQSDLYRATVTVSLTSTDPT